MTRRPIEVHNRFSVITVDAAQNNDSTTPSRFTIRALPSRSMRHENNDWMTPIEVHKRLSVVTVDAAQKQRLDDPHRGAQSNLCRHSRISVDASQNHDWMTPSRFKIGSLLSRLIRHKKRTTRRPHRRSRPAICDITVDAAQQQRLELPFAVHNRRAAVTVHPAQKRTTRRPHRRSQSAICAITVDPTQKQLLDDPFEVHNRLCVPSRSIRHKYNDLTTQSRFANSYVCHHGRCGTQTTTRRPHRGSQSAICVITVDPAQMQRRDDPSRFTIGYLWHNGRSITKNNDSTTLSGFTIAYVCHHGRSGTNTMT